MYGVFLLLSAAHRLGKTHGKMVIQKPTWNHHVVVAHQKFSSWDANVVHNVIVLMARGTHKAVLPVRSVKISNKAALSFSTSQQSGRVGHSFYIQAKICRV